MHACSSDLSGSQSALTCLCVCARAQLGLREFNIGDGTTTGTLGREWPSIGLTAWKGASVTTSCGWGDESGMVGAALLTECMTVCVNGANDCAHLPKVVVFV
jgi:hypothetical protein